MGVLEKINYKENMFGWDLVISGHLLVCWIKDAPAMKIFEHIADSRCKINLF